ncbi:hypothetical protein ANN_17061 [Periplaneta americana]|uniref:Uncharacterized protein n=1 Tax=Periplaneta americana TaxID=6978 RepID=A0ABQ8SRV5_PERAM|nr:hypothetical protein ANN_17061 [Periplaneta americana]
MADLCEGGNEPPASLKATPLGRIEPAIEVSGDAANFHIVQLSAILQEEWRRIPVDILHKQEESMPDRQQLDILAGVIKKEDIMQELQIEPIMQFISKYQLHWKGHLERMDRCTIPKALFHYHPHGKRFLGRPKKRWTENYSLRP